MADGDEIVRCRVRSGSGHAAPRPGQALADGVGRRGGAGVEAELGEDVGDVGGRRAAADLEGVGDVLVGAPLGDQPQHLALANG